MVNGNASELTVGAGSIVLKKIDAFFAQNDSEIWGN